MNTQVSRTKKLTMIAMLCAIAYAVMLVGRVPVVLFLKYDPKDVIITIGGFLFGPLASFAISTIVSLVEMFTTSETGIIGAAMNIAASCSFACVAAAIYKRDHSRKGGIIGLVAGCVTMTVVMLIWNYWLTPIYMGQPREAVAALLLPAILPFNIIKSTANMVITILIYKPVANALRRARLVDLPAPGKKEKAV